MATIRFVKKVGGAYFTIDNGTRFELDDAEVTVTNANGVITLRIDGLDRPFIVANHTFIVDGNTVSGAANIKTALDTFFSGGGGGAELSTNTVTDRQSTTKAISVKDALDAIIKSVSFTASIPYTASTTLMNKTVDAAIAFTPNTTGAIPGSGCVVTLIANGINEPSFSGFAKRPSSDDYHNVDGSINEITFFYNGNGVYTYSIQVLVEATPASPLLDGLIHYLKLDGNVTDVNGTAIMTPANVTYGAGLIGQAAILNGTTSDITGPTNSFSNTVTGFTIAGWFKLSASTNQTFFSKYSAGQPEYNVWKNGSVIRFDAWQGVGVQAFADAGWAYTSSDYVFVCFGYKPATTKIFISYNGNAVVETTLASMNAGAAAFKIGSIASSLYMNALVDEVGYWNRPLTAGEITSLYNAGAGKTHPFT